MICSSANTQHNASALKSNLQIIPKLWNWGLPTTFSKHYLVSQAFQQAQEISSHST